MANERRWSPSLGLSLCVIPLLALLVGLGVWQLLRGAEKARLEELQLDRFSALPGAPPAELDDVDFLRVRLDGAFEPGKFFLVDNQVVDGRPGYWILHSFRSSDGRRYLVNRGWVAGPPRRAELPEVETPQALGLRITGVVWPDLGMLPMLGEEVWAAGWPKRVPRMNLARMADALDAQPREVRLEAGQPGRLGPLPMSVGLGAEQHRGYAVQWFGLALILLAGYVFHGYRAAALSGQARR